jgi:gas vesicle protein
MATLQEQYIQIQEGKGNKNHFLKQAQYLFPDLVSVYNSYTEVVHILKGKNVLNESKAGLGMVSTPSRRIEDWVSIFQESIKAEEKKVSKEVTDTQDHNFDYKDTKNIDNIYGQAFLNGFYDEMKDPKNKNKTADEVKQIVAKNLGKDILYYTTNAQFGVKGIGYQTEAPGLGEPKAPKGKYKSSGYGDIPKKTVKESIETRSVGPMVKPSSNEFKVGDTVIFKGTKQKITRIVDDRIYIKSEKYGLRPETWVKAQDLKKSKTNKNKISEAKHPNLASEPKGKYKSSGYGDLPKKKKD